MNTAPTHEGLMARIEEARVNVRKMKVHSPHLFPEWQELQSAESNLKEAQERLIRAKRDWDRVGRP